MIDLSMKCLKAVFVLMFVGLIFVETGHSQTIDVETNDAIAYGIRDAKLEAVWVDRKDEYVQLKERKTFLSFIIPQEYLSSGVILTAYSDDGSILGQNIWCAKTVLASSSAVPNTTKGPVESKTLLEVNPDLVNASRFSLSIDPVSDNSLPGPETCAECATIATPVCGSRGIQSMTCGGTSGTCTFTCVQ